jgi:RimJ/RimL family protein N-acetyltransferase
MLRVLSIEDMEPIRQWRNQCLSTLRTPFPLTKEQQEQWYRDEICNRASRSRFWGVTLRGMNGTDILHGYGGIENIQWENRIGEISLLIDPEEQGHGVGYTHAREIISRAFNELNLQTVYAECYENNRAISFWNKVFYGKYKTILPNRKYFDGAYYDSVYYSWSRV